MKTNVKKYALLVIDDDETIRDACCQTLGRNCDYSIAVAADGKTGIGIIKKTKPDMALVDLKLPGMGGIEVIQEIKKIDPDIATIIITGYPTIASAVKAIKEGAYDFLPKPFTPDELRLVVKRALDKKNLELKTRTLWREKEVMQRNFVSMVSHELRTPLISTRQYVDAVLCGAVNGMTPRQEEIFRRIAVRVNGLLDLIDNWLNLNRMNSGKFGKDIKPVRLLPIINEAIEILESAAKNKKVSINVDFPQGGLTVCGNKECLKEMMINLIGNAVKYNKNNGSVTIKAAHQESKGFSIEIQDTGRGIPEKDMPYIFDEFFRGEDSPGDEPKSSGLGLSIVRQIIELHSGTIKVSSKVGEGSVFTVTLPETICNRSQKIGWFTDDSMAK